LLKIFSPYGAIESARVLVHKQCGFINFENLDDAVTARKALNGQEVLGPEIGPIKIGFAKVPNKMPDTPVFDNNMVDPTAAYQALKRLGGATAVPLEEQLSAGHLENFRSPMALQLANGLNGLGPHSAAGLTQSLQPAVGLSPSVVASEFGGDHPPQGVPLPSISEQQILVKELSGDTSDAEAHAQAISGSLRRVESRSKLTWLSCIQQSQDRLQHILQFCHILRRSTLTLEAEIWIRRACAIFGKD
jgi:protein JSN1